MTGDYADDDLLVGNPERERAIGLLTEAFSAGYLEMLEFEDRSASVYASRTRGELRASLKQLPTAGHLFPDAPSAAQPEPAVIAPGASTAASTVNLDADWATVRRTGVWQVPAHIVISGSMGTAHLDFSRAEFATPVVDVELQVSISTVKIWLGPGHDLRRDQLVVKGWSSVKDKAGPPVQPGPLIRLRGAISMTSALTIKRR